MWRRLSTKVLLVHPRLTVVEDNIVLPRGKETQYLRFENEPDAVSIICRRSPTEVLLQREYSYPVGRWQYQFPAGLVEAKETPRAAASRELMEESGYHAGKLRELGLFYTNNRRSTQRMFVFIATDLSEAKLPADVEEIIENSWHEEREIDMMISKGAIDNLTILASWGMYKAIASNTDESPGI